MIKLISDIFPAGADGYIVGGSIRDILLGRSPTDYDVAVPGNPEKFAAIVAANTGGHLVEIGKAGLQILRVVSSRHVVDVAPMSGPTIESDLNQRDFTIDALAYHLSSGRLIDPLNGRADLSLKQVRMVSRGIFSKDPIRLLRAFRIAALLEFSIEAHTVAAVRKDATRIQQSAGERIRAELFTLFEVPQSYPYLIQMADCGLLFAIFPEMTALKGCRQNGHHVHDVFDHTLRSYHHLERLIREFRMPRPASEMNTDDFMAVGNAGMLKCAVLLHDIGKPPTRTVAADGSVHFYGHAEKSADMADSIGSRLKFSRRQKQFLDSIISNHLRPLALFTARRNNSLTPRGLARFYLKCGDNTPFLLLHSLADIQAKKNDPANADFKLFVTDLLQGYFVDFKPIQANPPLITGADLIKEFNLTPSPRFKQILAAVEEARLSQQLTTRKDALALVENLLSGNHV
ncbi:MAG: HD domain-containing protein [Desulfobacterales bacterium]|nr:HD domain-containing protein [Desulfobacterales bacterium]